MISQNAQPRRSALGKKIGWAVLLLMAAYPVLVSLGYLTLDPDDFSFAEQRAVYLAHHAMLMVHIVAAMLAILIGSLQFWPALRKGLPLKLHRWLGRAYLLSGLAGGLGGLYMAQFAYGGLIARLGFATLALLWLYSGYRSCQQIRNRDIVGHRQWMIRNYALTPCFWAFLPFISLRRSSGWAWSHSKRFYGNGVRFSPFTWRGS
jgi:uncharacterized membrane protein